MRLCIAALLLAIGFTAVPASAQVLSDKLIPVNLLAAVDGAGANVAPALIAKPAPKPAGATLSILYAGMVALQALDVASTHKALAAGGTYEANPVFGSVVGSMPASIAMKAGATAGIIYLTHKVSKTNRVAAIVTMVALNSAYATIVAHNYSVASHASR